MTIWNIKFVLLIHWIQTMKTSFIQIPCLPFDLNTFWHSSKCMNRRFNSDLIPIMSAAMENHLTLERWEIFSCRNSEWLSKAVYLNIWVCHRWLSEWPLLNDHSREEHIPHNSHRSPGISHNPPVISNNSHVISNNSPKHQIITRNLKQFPGISSNSPEYRTIPQEYPTIPP